MKKLIGKIHLWLGLISGIIVFILGITGCIYVFIEDIKPLVYKDRLFVKAEPVPPQPLSVLLEKAQAAAGEIPVTHVEIPNSARATYAFEALKAKPENNSIWYWDKYDYYTLYVNPYTAEIVKMEDTNFEFFYFILCLHWCLLLENDLGQPIVGIAVIVFVVSLITGLVLWWPKNKSAARQRFWFRWKASTQWKRKNYDLHNILGFYTMIIALILALTGLMWAFDWFEHSVEWMANGGKSESTYVAPEIDTTRVSSDPLPDKILADMRGRYPQAASYHISFREKSPYYTYANLSHGTRYNSVSLTYNQYSGELVAVSGFKDYNAGEKLVMLNYDIHVGAVLGLPGKILAFLGSLVAASLPVTGFLVWWGRRKKQPFKKDGRRSGFII